MNHGVLTGLAVVVTGATRGLGGAFARALAAQGAALVVNGTNADTVAALVADLRSGGTRVIGVPGSVADPEVAQALVDTSLTEFGSIDVLVNNAGITRDRTVLRMTVEEFDEVVAVNLRGAWLCGTRAAAAMAAAGRGSIINIVSEAAFYGAFGQSNYAASKAGLVALTNSWAVELAKYGITVNGISPTALTDMTEVVVGRARDSAAKLNEKVPDAADLGIGAAADNAPLVVFLASPAARTMTGQIFSFNGEHLGVWSHPATVSVASSRSWSVDSIAKAFTDGTLETQRTHKPSWVEQSIS